jgi:hypothetical protein
MTAFSCTEFAFDDDAVLAVSMPNNNIPCTAVGGMASKKKKKKKTNLSS